MGSLRDRFFTPQVAKAIVSPSAIVITAAGVAAGIALPVAWPVAAVAAAVFAFGGLAARIGLALPRGQRTSSGRIDPFTLDEPWRRLMQDTLAARHRFDDAVRRTAAGPVRDRLNRIVSSLDDNVDDAWRTAQAGQALSEAYERLGVRQVEDELAQYRAHRPAGETAAATEAAMVAQIDTARRMWDTIASTHDRLRLLAEQLDDAATRAIELSVGVFRPDKFAQLEARLGSITQELTALREGLDATDAAEAHGTGNLDVMAEVDAARTNATEGQPGRSGGSTATGSGG